MVKRLPTMQETRVQSLGWEDLLEKETATHCSILAWKIPWMEEPGRLQSMGSQRVRHDRATSLHHTCVSAASLLAWWHMLHQLRLLSSSQGQIPSSDPQPHLWPFCPLIFIFFLLIKKIKIDWSICIWLHWVFIAGVGFLPLRWVGATLPCGAQAAFCGDFSCCWAQALGWAGFSSCALRAPECWFSGCDSET